MFVSAFCFAIEFKMSMINLRSADDALEDADIEIPKYSGTIKNMLENGLVGEDDEVDVPVAMVKPAVSRKIMEWVEHYKDDTPPIQMIGERRKNKMTFQSGTSNIWIFDLILATAKTFAITIEGKSAVEIRTAFGIKTDSTEAKN